MPRTPRHSHLYYALADDDLIVLDARRDRYALLPDARAAANEDGRLVGTCRVTVAAVAVLAEAHLFDAGRCDTAILSHVRPTSGILGSASRTPAGAALRRSATFLAALAESILRLAARRYGTCTSVRAGDLGDIAGELDRFAWLLAHCPGMRRCLPRSLLLRAYLHRRGYPTSLVFGVRTHPFLAHCWLEGEAGLLDAESDAVAGFVPIMIVGAP